ncbi:MAG TPA: PAS domain-containing protein, partial [Chroococcidiopsis sp.]
MTRQLPASPLPDRLFQAFCNGLPDALLATDGQQRLIYMNPQAEALLGYPCELLQGQPLKSCLPSLTPAVLTQACEQAIAQASQVSFEQFYAPKKCWLEVRVSAHADGLMLQLRDTTARHKTQQSIQDQAYLSEVTTELSVILQNYTDLSSLLDRCARHLVAALSDVALVRVWTLNYEDHLLESQAIAGLEAYGQDLPQRIPLGISIVGLIAQNQTPYLTNDAARDICLQSSRWLSQERIRSFAGYPLIVNNRLAGVMILYSRQPITTALDHSLRWISSSLAIAIDRAMVQAELLNRRESLLFRLSNHIRNSLDLDNILDTTVQEVRQL